MISPSSKLYVCMYVCMYRRSGCARLSDFLDKYGETVAVVYEHTKRTQNIQFADGAQYITFSMLNQEPAFA